MSERLYSEKIYQKLEKYFEEYGWSILRGSKLNALLNEAYLEGKASGEKKQ